MMLKHFLSKKIKHKQWTDGKIYNSFFILTEDHLSQLWAKSGVLIILSVSMAIVNVSLPTLDLLKKKETCIVNTVSNNSWHHHAANATEKLR